VTSGAIATSLLAAALLPGALFQWGFERNAGRYGIGLKDRILRVTGTSALFLAMFAWPLHWLYANYWDQIAAGKILPRLIYAIPIIYLLIPSIIGWIYGSSLKKEKAWARKLAGTNRFPTAWDYALSGRKGGWIRCQLKSGIWVGGLFSDLNSGEDVKSHKRSYASGYPEAHELYLYPTVLMDRETGEFKTREDGQPLLGIGGLLLFGEEIAIVEFIDTLDWNGEHA